MMWKGLWLGEPETDPNLAPDVAGKWLFKTKGAVFAGERLFLRSHVWFVYIQFLITISSPFIPWSKDKPGVPYAGTLSFSSPHG